MAQALENRGRPVTFRKSRLDQAIENASALVGRHVPLPSAFTATLERSLAGAFRRDLELDGIDAIAIGLVATIGAAMDFLVVAIPQDVVYLEQYPQAGSILTKLFKAWMVPSDNGLAAQALASFDRIDSRVPGMFPGNHRLLTPGHDPALGFVLGVFDLLRGGRTAIGTDGTWRFENRLIEPANNIAAALILELLHLLSDVATKAGLPAPLMTAAGLLRVGSFGVNDRTVADLAHYMYLKGYDLRHFVTTCSTPLAMRALLGGYFLARQHLDADYRARTEAAARRDAPALKDPKLTLMTLLADGIACAANAGKIALYQGNPSAFNYAQWLALLRSGAQFITDRLESVTEVLLDKSHANDVEIERRWKTIEQLFHPEGSE